jgi:hypothetical protein
VIQILKSQVDPLHAAKILLAQIESKLPQEVRLVSLCRALDRYIYAVGFLESADVDVIENVEFEGADVNDLELRESISAQFPELGFYWTALNMEIVDGAEGELGVGDAIDDLLDITKELREVIWFEQHHGENEARAALRFRQSSHLYMHVFPLRLYLEEVIRK